MLNTDLLSTSFTVPFPKPEPLNMFFIVLSQGRIIEYFGQFAGFIGAEKLL